MTILLLKNLARSENVASRAAVTVVMPDFFVTQAFPTSVDAATEYPGGAFDESDADGLGLSGLPAARVNWYVLVPLENVRLSPEKVAVKEYSWPLVVKVPTNWPALA